MKTNIPERIAALREAMRQQKVDAYIIPSSDPHLSEYPADRWKSREWISGFTGSAGTIVVTADKAGLWTDSRYFLQAASQLEGSGIELYKLALPETPSITEFLLHELHAGQAVGLDGQTYSAAEASALANKLSRKEIKLDTSADLIEGIWKDRPAVPGNPIFEMPEALSGASVHEKLDLINNQLRSEGADCLILAALDEIAWTFNIRGTDVTYNPVVVSYAFVSEDESVLFIKPEKLTAEITEHLKKEGVTLAEYSMVPPTGKQPGIRGYEQDERLLIRCDPGKLYDRGRDLPRQSLEEHQERDRDQGIPKRRGKRWRRLDKILYLAGEKNGGRSPSYRDQRRREADSLTCGTTAIHHG